MRYLPQYWRGPSRKTIIVLLSTMAAAILGRIVYVQASFQVHDTVDFTKSTNLKAIYDGGLRPWRAWQNSTSTLLVTDAGKVHILLPDSKPFETFVQIGSFDILAGNQLAETDFSGYPISLTSAAKQTHRICDALGITTNRLDETVATLRRMGNQAPFPYRNWAASTEKGEMRVQVRLEPVFGLFTTDGVVYVTIQFANPGLPMKFLDRPIQPPPGYEGVSMDMPGLNTRRATPLPPKVEAAIKQMDAAIAKEKADKARSQATPPPTAPAAAAQRP